MKTAPMSESPETVTVTPLVDGPLEVTGRVHVVAPDGTEIRDTAKCYLCRCGQSENKPFCDGSHKRVGWSSHSS